MRKKFSMFFVLSMVTLLCMVEKTYAMNTFRQRFQQANYQINWGNVVGGGIFCGTAGGLYAGMIANGLRKLEFESENQSDVDPIVEEFVRTLNCDQKAPNTIDPHVESFIKGQLSRCGVNEQSIEMVKSHRWAVSSDEKIVLHVRDHDKLKFWLKIKHYLPQIFYKNLPKLVVKNINGKTVRISPEEYLRQAAAIIHHEGGHILHKDKSFWRDQNNPSKELHEYATIAGILVAHLAFFCKNRAIAVSLAGLIVGAFHQIRPKELLWFSRYQEARADENIENNIHLLRAYKHYLKNCYYVSPDFFDSNNPMVFTHPHPQVAIQRLKERIKALKENGDQKAFEDPLAVKEDAQIK